MTQVIHVDHLLHLQHLPVTAFRCTKWYTW